MPWRFTWFAIFAASMAPAFGAEVTDSGPAAPLGVPAEPRTLEPEEPTVRGAPEGTPSLQISPDFVTPGLAFGGYFPVPELESGAIKVGPVTVRAAAHAGMGYDDNVTLSATNKVSSMFFTLTPSVVLGLEGATQRYYAVYRGNYRRYTASSADNLDTHNFGLAALHEWTSRLKTGATYDYLRGQDPRGTTATAVAAPDVWQQHTLRGTVTYGAPGAIGLVEVSPGYLKRDYVTDVGAVGSRTYEQFDLGGAFHYRLAPKTRATVLAGHSDIRHDLDPSFDSTENRVLVGVTWEALAKTQGTFRYGYMSKQFSSSRPGFSTPTYEAAVAWSPRTYSNVTLRGARSFAEATEVGSNAIVVDAVSLSWAHAWDDRVRSTVGYVYGRQNHEGASRTDIYHSLDVKASYAFHRRLRIGAQFRHDARLSPDPTLEYRRNLTLVTLETAL